MGNVWNAASYERNARFVSDLGSAVLDLLNPQPGERILDIGCGDGALTARIAQRGGSVVAIDNSTSMVEAARARGIDARLGSATSLEFAGEFDAVFSNAVLHWVPDADTVLRGVARALKPGGRFVAEFGGFGNIAAIRVAQQAALEKRGLEYNALLPKYFPSPRAYGELLAQHGFAVSVLDLIPRPTPIQAGMRAWLETFSRGVLDALPDREHFLDEVIEALRPVLCDEAGNWFADYVRLRVAAKLTGSIAR
jgi:trans-aconitate methyltransferase